MLESWSLYFSTANDLRALLQTELQNVLRVSVIVVLS